MKHLFIGLLLSVAFNSYAQRDNIQSGNPLLSQAFWQGKPGVEAVKAEVAKGNNPSEMNGASFDPVVLAINNNAPNETVVYLLQQQGNDVNKLTHDGRTYIFWAASKGNTELMQHLIANKAKLDKEDNHGYSVFNFAAVGGQQNTAVYDLLLQNGANPKTQLTHDGANAILLAIGNDPELKLTEYFQSKGLELNSKDAAGNTAFDYAARSGNMVVMKKLLEKGINPTNNAMLMAAQGSRRGGNTLAVFQYLESLGIKPTVTGKGGENALHAIVRRPGQIEVIQYFLSKGVNVNAANEEGNTVFMNAAATNADTATLALLRSKTTDINKTNKNGATALTLAVRSNSADIVKYLIKEGAKTNIADAKGATLVYYLFESYTPAASKNFEAKLALLQANGVKMTTPMQDGNTLYHLAVAKNDIGLVKLVQPFGVDINAKNKEGMTALHKAAMVSKDGKMLEYLLSIGAKKEVKTAFDETAYDLAKENEILAKQNVSVEFLKL
jgi:ankyrin repeat protein